MFSLIHIAVAEMSSYYVLIIDIVQIVTFSISAFIMSAIC